MANIITKENYNRYIHKGDIVAAVINVTNACNLKCKYCFTHPNPRTMDLDTGKAVIKFLMNEQDAYLRVHNGDRTKMIPPMICFFGGEPMLGFETLIKPLILWAENEGIVNKYDFRFTITSNGTLLNEERSSFLFNHKVGLLLSIDGAPATQDLQRPYLDGSKSSETLLKNIPIILKYWPDVTFRSTVEPYSAKDLFDNYMWARKMGFMNYFVTPNAFQTWEEKDVHELLTNVTKIENMMIRDIIVGNTPLVWGDLMEQCRYNIDHNLILQDKGDYTSTIESQLERCGLGIGSIGVGVDGSISGCQERNTYVDSNDPFYLGNIKTGIDIDLHIKLLNKFLCEKTSCRENTDRCNNCSRGGGCKNSSCLARNWDMGTNLNLNSEINCIWNDFLFKSMRLMLESINRVDKEVETFMNFFIKYYNLDEEKEVTE